MVGSQVDSNPTVGVNASFGDSVLVLAAYDPSCGVLGARDPSPSQVLWEDGENGDSLKEEVTNLTTRLILFGGEEGKIMEGED